MKYTDFEDFLGEIHSKDYMGTDEDMPESFENWLANLDAEEFIKYANEYKNA